MRHFRRGRTPDGDGDVPVHRSRGVDAALASSIRTRCAPALARHDALAARRDRRRPAAVVVKTTGDGFHAVFVSDPGGAVDAAVAAQRRAGRREPGRCPSGLRVRMGLHTGAGRRSATATTTAPPVNRAARVMSRGPRRAGRGVARDRGARPPTPCHVELALSTWASTGSATSAGRERIFQVVAIRTSSASSRRSRSFDARSRATCPVQLTSFVGRDVERRTRSPTRCWTTSRLVTADRRRRCRARAASRSRSRLDVAARASPTARGCASWPPADDADASSAQVVAATLGVRAPHRRARSRPASIVEFLQLRELLLVLDNCEHLRRRRSGELADAVAPASARGSRVLATSREALGVAGEQVCAACDSLGRCRRAPRRLDVIACQRGGAARSRDRADDAVQPSFDARDERQWTAVAEICRRRRRHPAGDRAGRGAGRRSMNPIDIAGRLDERFRLLTGGASQRRSSATRRCGRRSSGRTSSSIARRADWSSSASGRSPGSFDAEAVGRGRRRTRSSTCGTVTRCRRRAGRRSR